MKLYEKYSESGFHTSIATTFNIDFDAYEAIVLARLRGAGCRNNLLVCDKRMVTAALDGAFRMPRYAGRLYSVSEAEGAQAGGVFHPKIFLQLGRQAGRLLIGSANLTASGIAGNLEIVGELKCTEAPSGEQRLIQQAFQTLQAYLDQDDPAVAAQLELVRRRTPWLGDAPEPLEDAVSLEDGTLGAFLPTGRPAGVAARYIDLVAEKIDRLIVVSPYWDDELAALKYLSEALEPSEISIMVDSEALIFPPIPEWLAPIVRFYDSGASFKKRFIHAKLFIAETKSADHLLLGSANCTIAALGNRGFGGLNSEACLYRRLPAGSVRGALGLDKVFDNDPVPPEMLSLHTRPESEIELDRLGSIHPGSFSLLAGALTWRPSARFGKDVCEVCLLDGRGEAIPADLIPMPVTDGPRMFRISALPADTTPLFAKVRRPGDEWSARAIITHPQEIQIASRERGAQRLEQALSGLEDTSIASLHTLEIFDLLQRLDQEDRGAQLPNFVPRPRVEVESGGATFEVMSYEDFLKTRRRPDSEPDRSLHTSLAGSVHFSVRSVLNRLLGVSEQSLEVEEEGTGQREYDQNDETQDPFGEEGGRPAGHPPDEIGGSDDPDLLPARDREAAQEHLLKAVVQFQKRLREKQGEQAIDTVEMLRVRLMLMIICQAAYCAEKSETKRLSFDKVLPAEDGGNGWSDVFGRMIFALVNGPTSPLRQLYFQNLDGQVPVDLLECWATCYWCLQACFAAPLSPTQRARMERFLKPHVVALYQLTLPSKAELLSETVLDIMKRMSAIYGPDMKVDGADIERLHRNTVEASLKVAV